MSDDDTTERSIKPEYEAAPQTHSDAKPNRKSLGGKLVATLVLVAIGIAGYGMSAGWFENQSGDQQSPRAATGSIARAINSQLDDVQRTPPVVAAPKPPLPLRAIAPQDVAGILDEGRAVAQHLVATSGTLDALEMQARYEFELGAPDKAKQIWTKILESQPNYVFALSGLGSIATREGRLDDAVKYYRRAVLADAQNPTYQVELANALLSNNELDEARRLLASVSGSYPDYVEAHVQLGTVLNQLGQFEEAKPAFLRALELAPDSRLAHFGLATALRRLDDKEAAAVHQARYAELQSEEVASTRSGRVSYDDVQAMSIDVARFYGDMARVYLATGNTDDAHQLLVRASRMNPQDINSRQALAWISNQRGRMFDSILWLRQVAALQPEVFSYVLEIGRLYVAVNQLDEAERVLLDFVTEHPDDAEATYRLAEFYLDAKRDLDLALKYARAATETQPTSGAFEFLSTVYQERQELPEAIESLERAIELAPGNSTYPQLLAILKETLRDSGGATPIAPSNAIEVQE